MKLPTPSVADKPHQPLSFKFPKCKLILEKSVAKRSFQPQWFAHWKWLHYDKEHDLFHLHDTENKRHSATSLETMYIPTGYGNWKDACTRCTAHNVSTFQKDADYYTLATTCTAYLRELSNLKDVVQQVVKCSFLDCKMCALVTQNPLKVTSFSKIFWGNMPPGSASLHACNTCYTTAFSAHELYHFLCASDSPVSPVYVCEERLSNDGLFEIVATLFWR